MPTDVDAFRAEVRAFVAEHGQPMVGEGVRVPRSSEDEAAVRAWLASLYEAGLLGGGWPVERGGRAVGPRLGDDQLRGEKIFAEEVEAAIVAHPDVDDVVVASRPSARWGQEVVAIVQPCAGSSATEGDLSEEAARCVARYKLPKAWVFVDALQRSPAGKAGYRWATAVAASAAAG